MRASDKPGREYFVTSLEHILTELERIDLLIRVLVYRARQVQGDEVEFQGLYISEEEVDTLMAAPAGLPRWAIASVPSARAEVTAVLEEMKDQIARGKAGSARRDITLRLDELSRLFQLTPFDVDALLICLAPELDLRYERLYAYLQDDVTRKRPSVDLVLNMSCASFQAKMEARQRFLPSSPLLKNQLLEIFTDPSQNRPPLLSKYLQVDERVVNYLLECDEIAAPLLPYAQHVEPQARLENLIMAEEVKDRLALLTQKASVQSKGLVLYLQGSYGVGKKTSAEALCRELGLGMVVIEGKRLLDAEGLAFETAVKLAVREAWLQNTVLYWDGFDALLSDDKQSYLQALLRELEERPGITFLAGNTPWDPANTLREITFVRVDIPPCSYAERVKLWTRSLNGSMSTETALDIGALANQFRLSGGQIRDAATTALNLARWRNPENGRVTMDDLYVACRLQSNRNLAALAQKIIPHYRWEDIVLPPDRMKQLGEICNTVKQRARVYAEWGFAGKISLGKGVNVLFAGPSGTGKTMAAEIIANQLSLDLYRIDLSTVVSKYIGETEKNLARIFAEAETSNAILFFDEADALFGKRSEVKDSHDRYANIEISYLLQRMEAYDGITILATNLRHNMDDAFVRRMAFTVKFPFPEEEDRLRIWEGIWPPETPRAADLDLAFMARQFKLTGGNIKNIALAAAFLAAEDGQAVHMRHIIWATKREYEKMGKVVVEREFGEYAEQVRREA